MALTASCGSETTIGGNDIPLQTPTSAPKKKLEVSAPTRDTIFIQLSDKAPPGALDPSNYAITGLRGELEVLAAEVSGSGVLLTTAPQKLGVEYRLLLSIPGLDLDESFLAADTAQFWASDFSTADVDQVLVTAERVHIGTYAVAYVEEGTSFDNADDLVEFFDTQVYPVETELFNPAPDRDGNGRIVLLGLAGNQSFGGYFSSINAYSDEETMELYGRHSNEMEMLYLNTAIVAMKGEQVLAHEFAHVLYHETHDPLVDWGYQNEGLAECAVHAVLGEHRKALTHYQADPTFTIRDGLSLVNWTYGNYPQYAQSYVFWTYVASQLGGVSGFGKLFALDGNPDEVDAFLQEELGLTMAEVQLNSLLASWIQAPAGPYSFNGLVHFEKEPHVATVNSLELVPFAGAFLAQDDLELVSIPDGKGPDIQLVGINAFGQVDFDAPYDVAGGVLLALNTSPDFTIPEAQPTGLLPYGEEAVSAEADAAESWMHPPPFDPRHMDRTRMWQRRAGLLKD